MTAKFMWYELLTSQPQRAEGFYKSVVGWKTEKMGEGEGAYTIYETDKGGVAGMPVLPDDAPIKGEFWDGYIGVDDVDAYAQRVTKAGGKIHLPPHDIPGVGRSAMVEDPQGAVFTLFKGNQPEGPPTGDGPGYPAWHDLATSDPKAGLAFYTELFGWKPLDAMDMGEAGAYQIIAEDGSTAGRRHHALAARHASPLLDPLLQRRLDRGGGSAGESRRRPGHQRPDRGPRRPVDGPGQGPPRRQLRPGRPEVGTPGAQFPRHPPL